MTDDQVVIAKNALKSLEERITVLDNKIQRLRKQLVMMNIAIILLGIATFAISVSLW